MSIIDVQVIRIKDILNAKHISSVCFKAVAGTLVDKGTIALGISVEAGLVTVVMGEWEEALGTSYAIAAERNTSAKNRLLQERRYFLFPSNYM